MNPEDRWQEIAPKFRTPSEEDRAPYGFATRVVAAANLGLPRQSRALLLWCRYSLSMAGAAAILLGINLLNQPPIDQQFLPLPDEKKARMVHPDDIAILASDFGLDRLSPRESATAPTVPVANLSEEVLDRLRSSLDLTPEQETEIAPELEELTTLVLDSRKQALIKYYESLLNFHGEIATKLNLRQQKILEANRKLLQQEFSNRFNPQS